MRRALLITNPNAYRVTSERRRSVAAALGERYRVEEAETAWPGHASELALGAAKEGADLLVTLGGDGTVNEVVNALARTEQPMAVLPAGMANVFSRSLGIPDDPVRAAHRLAANGARPRMVPLGRIGDRWFAANAGIGFDAAIVRRVEAHQRAKRRAGDWYFVAAGLRVFASEYDRRRPRLRAVWGEGAEERRDGLFLAIVQNTSAYTYFGSRPMRVCPRATLDTGLDLLAMDRFSIRDALPVVASAFGRAAHAGRDHVLSLHDLPALELRSERPLPMQADGEFLGEGTGARVESVPGALALLY